MVVSPRYDAYDGAHYVGYAKIWLDGREHEVQFFHLYQDLGDGNGTDYIFVGHDCFMREHFYCDPHNGKVFTIVRITIKMFPHKTKSTLTTCSAALEAPLVLNIRGHTYGQDRPLKQRAAVASNLFWKQSRRKQTFTLDILTWISLRSKANKIFRKDSEKLQKNINKRGVPGVKRGLRSAEQVAPVSVSDLSWIVFRMFCLSPTTGTLVCCRSTISTSTAATTPTEIPDACL